VNEAFAPVRTARTSASRVGVSVANGLLKSIFHPLPSIGSILPLSG
jgi:hypothetical protein